MSYSFNPMQFAQSINPGLSKSQLESFKDDFESLDESTRAAFSQIGESHKMSVMQKTKIRTTLTKKIPSAAKFNEILRVLGVQAHGVGSSANVKAKPKLTPSQEMDAKLRQIFPPGVKSLTRKGQMAKEFNQFIKELPEDEVRLLAKEFGPKIAGNMRDIQSHDPFAGVSAEKLGILAENVQIHVDVVKPMIDSLNPEDPDLEQKLMAIAEHASMKLEDALAHFSSNLLPKAGSRVRETAKKAIRRRAAEYSSRAPDKTEAPQKENTPPKIAPWKQKELERQKALEQQRAAHAANAARLHEERKKELANLTPESLVESLRDPTKTAGLREKMTALFTNSENLENHNAQEFAKEFVQQLGTGKRFDLYWKFESSRLKGGLSEQVALQQRLRAILPHLSQGQLQQAMNNTSFLIVIKETLNGENGGYAATAVNTFSSAQLSEFASLCSDERSLEALAALAQRTDYIANKAEQQKKLAAMIKNLPNGISWHNISPGVRTFLSRQVESHLMSSGMAREQRTALLQEFQQKLG